MDEKNGGAETQGLPPTGFLSRPPLIGRTKEIRSLLAHLQLDRDGDRTVLLLHGNAGVGKTRMAEVVAAEAERRGWQTLHGQAFPAESGIPYSSLANALVPLVRGMDPERLAVLARGGEAQLRFLFPGMGAPGEFRRPPAPGEPEEFRVRLFWIVVEFLQHLAARDPVLLVLEDLHWTDAASLELLHFVARNVGEAPLRILCTFVDDFVENDSRLEQTVASLGAGGHLRRLRLEPLSEQETRELVSALFDVPGEAIEGFADRLHAWTRGNPFFAVETLRALVEDGRLHRRDDVWLGWESDAWEISPTVRDVLINRLGRCSADARSVAEWAAAAGDRISHRLTVELAELAEDRVIAAVDELRTRGILDEDVEAGKIVYRFTHPLLRECLYAELGLARARALHRTIADTLERRAGQSPEEIAEELAYHFVRSGTEEPEARAVRHLATAGRRALERRADVEATDYLTRAHELAEKLERAEDDEAAPEHRDLDPTRIVHDLARALQRQGRYQEALALWERLLARPSVRDGNAAEVAAIRRRMGLASFWSGRHDEALSHFDAGLARVDEPEERGRIRLARSVCLQEVGRWEEARRDVEEALADADAEGLTSLRASAHRALALLHTWRGPPDAVRRHGGRAVELAEECGDRNVAFWGRWALAVHEGMTGHLDRMELHISAARRIADELRSPVLRLWTDELHLEKAYVTGDWDGGLAAGERAVAVARSVEQRTLLPRLLVSTALIHLGRSDLERGRELVEEAWETATRGAREGKGLDVHVAVPAHIGRVAYHVAADEHEEAVRIGEEGLALAEESGYVIWAIHRLLPLMGEACLLMRDLEGARRIGERVRRESQRMDHALGRAWADACDALVTWLTGDVERGAELLRRAAERLESIPVVPDAARIRRQLAGRLADLGDREGALEELRRVHEIFARLRARRELDKTREQFRELESRPPRAVAGPGEGVLTGRELEVARLVADRNSNKAIAKRLGISHRTVGTHLSNIYQKLRIDSRSDLVDLVREGRLPAEPE